MWWHYEITIIDHKKKVHSIWIGKNFRSEKVCRARVERILEDEPVENFPWWQFWKKTRSVSVSVWATDHFKTAD